MGLHFTTLDLRVIDLHLDTSGGVIELKFGTPTDRLVLTRDQARSLSDALSHAASDIARASKVLVAEAAPRPASAASGEE